MPLPRAGWYDSPRLQYHQQWWTGRDWSVYVRRTPVPTHSNAWLWAIPLFWPAALFVFLFRTRW